MQQVLDWLNENELRAYPLLDSHSRLFTVGSRSWQLPDDFILDLQLIETSSSFSIASSAILLKSITYSATAVTVVFGNSVTDITSFEIDISSDSYPQYIRNSDGCLAVFGNGVKHFIDVCVSEEITEITLTTSIPVEPAVCVQFNGAWLGVNSIKGSPEKKTNSIGYAPKVSPLEDAEESTALAGDVEFLPGYNFRVLIADEKINLGIGSDYGLRVDCSTSFISSEYLDCSELVSYINGIPPDATGNFRLLAGPSIAITPGSAVESFEDPLMEEANMHTLFVGFTFQSINICNPVKIPPA